MSRFTFTERDILNTDLHHDPATGSFVSYRIYTPLAFPGRKTTSLVPIGHSAAGGTSAAIHWRERRFEIGGVKRDWTTFKYKPGGIFSKTRQWQWAGESFTVEYLFDDDKWIASSNSSRHPTRATFYPYKYRFVGSSEPGSISFSPDVSDEDTIFLILVMMYSEIRRQDRPNVSNHLPVPLPQREDVGF